MILIPKIKMPSGCEACPCWSHSICEVLPDEEDGEMGFSLPDKYCYSQTERYPGCPLVEIRIVEGKIEEAANKSSSRQEENND